MGVEVGTGVGDDQPALQVSVLGHARVIRDGVELDLGPPKHRAVLAALAMAEGQPVGVDTLASLVWPESMVPADPAGGLHVYVSGLRRVLEGPRAPGERPRVLVTSGGGYALDRERVRLDAVEVTEAAAAARDVLQPALTTVVPVATASREVLAATLARVDAALGRWRGEPFLDLADTTSVQAARARLDGVRAALLEHRAVAQLALGRHVEAAGQLGALVIEHVLDERLWCLYAVVLARSDRQADALEALRTVRLHLAEELGVDPGPALRELEGMLLRQDDALLAPVAAVLAPAASGPPQSGDGAAAPSSMNRSTPLVGRQREIGLLQQQRAAAGTRVVQVVGEAGIGKSSLVQLLAEHAGSCGDLVSVARCSEDEGAPPLWPWVQVLADLAAAGAIDTDTLPEWARRLIEGHDSPATTEDLATDAETARFRQFQAVERALRTASAQRRCVVLLEDLHWADSSTARLLAHLVSSWSMSAEQPDVLLLVTRRPDEGGGDHPALELALDAVARHGTLRLDLTGLTLEDVAELARRRADWEVDSDAASTLHDRTVGNAFLLVELLRLGAEALVPGQVPGGVTDVVQRRLSSMPETTRAVLATASVVGNEFDLDVVAQAAQATAPSGAPYMDAVDGVLEALDPAVAAGLVVDTSTDRMAFAHALTRDAVYAAISPPRRARHHVRVAQALETRTHRRGTSSETARHWLAAGSRYAEKAWRAALDAGLQSERELALDEAARLLDHAVTAQQDDLGATAEERFDLAATACRMLLRAGLWVRFLQRVEEAAAEAERIGDAEALARFAVMPAEAGPWTPRAYGLQDPNAIRRLRRVLELLPSHDNALRCRVMLALGSELYFSPSSVRERWALVEEGLAMARRLGDPRLQGLVSQRAALVIWRGGNAEARLRLATEAVDAAVDASETDLLQTSLELRMSAALEAGRIELLHEDLERARGLLRERPAIYHSVVVACLLVPWLGAQGRFSEAQEHVDEVARLTVNSQLPWTGLALGTARVGLAVWRGDLGSPGPELAEALTDVEAMLPSIRLLAHVRAGDVPAARAFLDAQAHRLVVDDFTSHFHQALAAEAAFVVGDPSLAASAYAALAGSAGQVACAGTGAPLGPVDAYLALAAAATGDLVAARKHAEDASRLIRSWGLEACDAWFVVRRGEGGF